MSLALDKLDEMLDGLEAALPRMIEEHPDDNSFWPLFSGHADVIEGCASAQDDAHVRARLSRMLQNAGKARPDDAGRSGAGHG